MLKKKAVERWRDQHPTVKAWLSRLAVSTAYNYLRAAYDFFEWIKQQSGYEGLEPEELLELQDKCHERERFKQLSMLQTWIQQQDVRLGTKQIRYSAVRSYYEHNHVPLPRDVAFRFRTDKPPIESELTFENLKKIILSSNPTYQAVFLIMFQGAMGCAEFEYFNENSWPEVKPQLEEGKQRFKITLPGRKHNKNRVPYYTFIGKDAVKALKAYLSARRRPLKNGEAIFLNEKGEPITTQALERYFTRHAIKVGVLKRWTPPCPKCGGETHYSRTWRGKEQPTLYICNRCGKETRASEIEVPRDIRYKLHPQEMRDLFRSEWDLSAARSICAEFFMGHDIDPNDYNKIMKLHPEWAEEQYANAEPFLNIISQDPRKVALSKVQQLEQKVQELEKRNLELKQRLNGYVLSDSQVQELLRRIEKLEKQAQKQK